ncbi:polysaccharide deacetylase [Caldicellulosiruptor acetigenus I77R1B]|uniref:Polysaccharide deacetylase n=1 Tax=Caldicellulosiruptor acetigenus (strain ATCC 700853 / DSM 12137 / I77R1B) TaxID=632335 RepID=E4S4D0_CALA7|nr:polysaccharide deacetylase family protein [Caldicellulosiruptor acetigenus]ADQ40367.1 polysaccharide deacetylase [Caldicellulosiruptor acetigenus I77R1B]
MNFKKIVCVVFLIISALFFFFASIHISKSFFSAIILKQNHTYIQEERLKTFEKPKLSQNQKLVKTNLNENDKAKNTVDTQNKDAQAEKQAKNEKIVYLTIDDGPSPVTSSILEILEKEKVKATFFVVGINCIKYPQYLKEIYQKGHLIGNHSYSHRYKSIYKDFNHFVEDFKKAQDTIYKIIGTKPKYYRFPGGSLSRVSPQIKKFLDANGIVYVDWNAITGDSTKNHENLTPNQILKITISTANKKNEVVLLMHDSSSKKNVIEALPSIIRAFKKQGYRFETIDKMQKPLQFKTKAASH